MTAPTLQLQLIPPPSSDGIIPSIHFVKYMGSKRNILGFLIPILEDVVPRQGRLLYLVAGTHSIGYAMKQHGPVWGNDIQHYTGMLGETLLRTDPAGLRDVNIDSCVGIPARRYYEHTSALWKPWLGGERDVLTLSGTDIDAGLAGCLAFIADLDAALPHGGDSRRLSPDLQDTVQHVVRGERVMPPMMGPVLVDKLLQPGAVSVARCVPSGDRGSARRPPRPRHGPVMPTPRCRILPATARCPAR